jgi:hypothetical protein
LNSLHAVVVVPHLSEETASISSFSNSIPWASNGHKTRTRIELSIKSESESESEISQIHKREEQEKPFEYRLPKKLDSDDQHFYHDTIKELFDQEEGRITSARDAMKTHVLKLADPSTPGEYLKPGTHIYIHEGFNHWWGIADNLKSLAKKVKPGNKKFARELYQLADRIDKATDYRHKPLATGPDVVVWELLDFLLVSLMIFNFGNCFVSD